MFCLRSLMALARQLDGTCLSDTSLEAYVILLKSPVMHVVVVLLLYVPSQQLWSLRDGQFT